MITGKVALLDRRGVFQKKPILTRATSQVFPRRLAGACGLSHIAQHLNRGSVRGSNDPEPEEIPRWMRSSRGGRGFRSPIVRALPSLGCSGRRMGDPRVHMLGGAGEGIQDSRATRRVGSPAL